MKSARLFFAIWPDDLTQRELCRIAGLCVHGAGGRRVPERNLHLTLLFLGAVSAAQREALERTAQALELPPLSLCFDRLEYWPKARILCLTSELADQYHPLATAVHRLRRSARQLGLKVDERPYCPHVTLARKVDRLVRPPPIEPLQWDLGGLSLVESVPERGRYRYRTLRHW